MKKASDVNSISKLTFPDGIKKCFWLLSCLDFKFWSCFLSFPCSYVNMAGLLCLMYPRKYLPAFLQWQSVALMQLSLSEILQLLTQRILNFFGHKIRLATSYHIVSCNPELQLTLCGAQLSESARIWSCPLYRNTRSWWCYRWFTLIKPKN